MGRKEGCWRGVKMVQDILASSKRTLFDMDCFAVILRCTVDAVLKNLLKVSSLRVHCLFEENPEQHFKLNDNFIFKTKKNHVDVICMNLVIRIETHLYSPLMYYK